ncbi:MAG: hypothetical protein EON90_02165 [Brevundimonas sp.]|nr:MAG: hypothetical protein EON90_02165 [Brevundimonas sp.]
MKVCFFANFGKTLFYDAIGRVLRERGHEVVWMTPSARWNERLLKGGGRREHLLDLSTQMSWRDGKTLSAQEEDHLAGLESRCDLSVNDMITMDRALRLMPDGRARAYLAMVERESRSFFQRTRPDVVLGEATWGWELMAGAVARDLGIGQFCFSSVRFPSERVAFSNGYRDQRLFPVRPRLESDRSEAERLLDAFRARPVKPLYEASNAALPTFRHHWLAEATALLSGAEKGNPQARSLFSRVASRGAMLRNLIQQRLFPPFEGVPAAPRKPFALVLLHVQPESTIDAYGSAHMDQIDNVAMLARVLPATHEIYVKEHPSAAGDRGGDYYRRLKSIPGVRLIQPRADTFSLIREAWLVMSVAGSACYEAGLLGVPAATLAPLFFSDLMIAPQVTPKSEGVRSLSDKVAAFNAVSAEVHRERAVALIADVLRCSFPAIVSDPASNPACIDRENLSNLADGIEGLHAMSPNGDGRVADMAAGWR